MVGDGRFRPNPHEPITEFIPGFQFLREKTSLSRQPRIEILDKELDGILRVRRRESARLTESPCG